MKEYKFPIILACFIFLYGNTSDYWLYNIGGWAFPIILINFIAIACAIGYVIYYIVTGFSEKYKNRKKNILTLSMIAVLAIAFVFPSGLVPKKIIYGGEILVGFLDGVAGNNAYLTLYGNNTYIMEYGFHETKGDWMFKGDTIFFDSPQGAGTYTFDYATFWNDRSHISFGKDSVAYSYIRVLKNELMK